jgi:hypothetical protein
VDIAQTPEFVIGLPFLSFASSSEPQGCPPMSEAAMAGRNLKVVAIKVGPVITAQPLAEYKAFRAEIAQRKPPAQQNQRVGVHDVKRDGPVAMNQVRVRLCIDDLKRLKFRNVSKIGPVTAQEYPCTPAECGQGFPLRHQFTTFVSRQGSSHEICRRPYHFDRWAPAVMPLLPLA